MHAWGIYVVLWMRTLWKRVNICHKWKFKHKKNTEHRRHVIKHTRTIVLLLILATFEKMVEVHERKNVIFSYLKEIYIISYRKDVHTSFKGATWARIDLIERPSERPSKSTYNKEHLTCTCERKKGEDRNWSKTYYQDANQNTEHIKMLYVCWWASAIREKKK